ncbi:MAG: hypothetical protein WC279_02720 [Sulfurimonas sp.]|jgi:hypothetical protein|uniref:hypothetical protein n=1 Tax=Sulfurimonas sp. TaxID=2022749 RepID=UPI003561C403
MSGLNQTNNFQNSKNETGQNFEGANIVNQKNSFILNINYQLLRKWFLFFFVHSAMSAFLFFVMHATTNTPLYLSIYFEVFFGLIFFGYIPLMFTVGVILFIVLIVIKMFKLIFNVKKRL